MAALVSDTGDLVFPPRTTDCHGTGLALADVQA